MSTKALSHKQLIQKTLWIAVPIMIQNAITNFVGMLDNIMVGQIGTNQMTGVSIVNQLIFVFNLMIFGGTAGIGIFTAQFAGKNDQKGLMYTVRLKVAMAVVLTLLGIGIFLGCGDAMVQLWMSNASSASDITETMKAAHGYLLVMLVGIFPFAMSQVYASTLRENGETRVPMIAGVIAIFVNLMGNYILIYGKFGAPKMGVLGAATATVLSRFVEVALVMFWSHRHTQRFPFMKMVYRGFGVPKELAISILLKAFPLLLNETLWSLGQTALSQQYSTLGLSVVAAFNISNTIANVFNVAFISMGDATAIILGQELGRMDSEEDRKVIKYDAFRLAIIAVVLCVISGSLLAMTAGAFPKVYNTTDEIKRMATYLILVSAAFMPVYAYENASYFTLRSGGKTWITFLFDSVFVWVISVPAAFVFTRFTDWGVVHVFIAVQCFDFIKMAIGFFMVRHGAWMHNLTAYQE
ncbi:putative efflux protein, MATE family [Lachnospiraceae bacterium A10]|nr:putative efflux protein, MATE family [Lachnospiraceae bacterium A10]